MFLAKLKTAAALLAALTCVSLGMIATLAGPAPPRQEPPAATVPKAAEKPQAPPRERSPEVTVESVRRSRWARTTIQPASVKAFDSADLYARAPGYLTSVRVNIGSRVKKDEILAELFDPGLSAVVEKARAEVEKAQAHVTRAMAALDVARAAADAQHLKSGYAESLAQRKGISQDEVAHSTEPPKPRRRPGSPWPGPKSPRLRARCASPGRAWIALTPSRRPRRSGLPTMAS